MEKPKIYSEYFKDGKTRRVEPYKGESILQFKRQWEQLSENDIISVEISESAPGSSMNSPIGALTVMETVRSKTKKMTASKYCEICKKLEEDSSFFETLFN